MRSQHKVPTDLANTLKGHGIAVGDLVFYITSKCNLRCAHCYVGNPLLNENVFFDHDSIRTTLESFEPLDRLTVLGGEPLLHPDIERVVATIAKTDCAEKRITTNLTVPVETSFLEICRDGGIRLVVSLDGSTKFIHESIRGPNTFERTIGNILTASAAQVDVEITHTVTSLSIGRIRELILFAQTLGVRRINFHSLSLVGNASNRPDLAITPTEWRRMVDMLRSLRSDQGTMRVRYELGFVSEDEMSSLRADGYHHHASSSFYAPGRQRIVIYPDRRVYISSEAFQSQAFIADIGSDVTKFNELTHNEWIQSVGSDFTVTNLQPTRCGDALYPHAISVSFREDYSIKPV